MERSHSVVLAALFGLSALGCATVTPPAARNVALFPADMSCRRVAVPDGTSQGALQEYCGNAAKWAEFDRQAAAKGISCRNTGTREALCLFARQWVSVDYRRGAGAGRSEFPATDVSLLSPTYATQVSMQRASDLANGYTVPATGSP